MFSFGRIGALLGAGALLSACGGGTVHAVSGSGAVSSVPGQSAATTLRLVYPTNFHTARAGRIHGGTTQAGTRAAASVRHAQYINPTTTDTILVDSDGSQIGSFPLSSGTTGNDNSSTFTISLLSGSHLVEVYEEDAQLNTLAYGSTNVTLTAGTANALSVTMLMNATQLALTSDALAGSDALAFPSTGTGSICVAPSVTPLLYAFAADPSLGFVLPGTAAGGVLTPSGAGAIPTPTLTAVSASNAGTSTLASTPLGFKPIFDGAQDDINATFSMPNPYTTNTSIYHVTIGTGSSSACQPAITQFAAAGSPDKIVVGPDSKLWFNLENATAVANIDPNATTPSVTTYGLSPAWTPYAYGIVFVGSTLWTDLVQIATTNLGVGPFSLSSDNLTAFYSLSSTATTFGIAAGGDGRVYVGVDDQTGSGNNTIQPVEANGVFDAPVVLGVGSTNRPFHLLEGPDGNIYFGFSGQPGIGKVTTAGVFTTYTSGISGQAYGATVGPDGAIWFGEAGNVIGRITTAGVATEYTVAPTVGVVYAIATGPDNDLWFVTNNGGLGRMTPAGVVTNFWTLPGGHDPESLVTGPDKAIWVTDVTSNTVYRVVSPY